MPSRALFFLRIKHGELKFFIFTYYLYLHIINLKNKNYVNTRNHPKKNH